MVRLFSPLRASCASLKSRPRKSQRRKLSWLWNSFHHHHCKIMMYVHIQLFSTTLKPKTKQGQGVDLIILTKVSLKTTAPGPKSLVDLDVQDKSRSDTTHAMIATFSSVLRGTILYTSQVFSDDLETSKQNPFGDECHLLSSQDIVKYSKGAPNPKHHSQAMRSTMKAEWIKSQTSKIYGW